VTGLPLPREDVFRPTFSWVRDQTASKREMPAKVASEAKVAGEVGARLSGHFGTRRQLLLAGYSLSISAFSPMMNLYQIMQLQSTKAVNIGVAKMGRMVTAVYPQQVALRMAQVNLATPVKENMNPWVAFCVLGVLQGAVYGQGNISFARMLGLEKVANFSIRTMFRGSIFAGLRDIISQGVPFMLSKSLSQRFLDPIVPANTGPSKMFKHWFSVLSLSVASTYISHGFHVCQTTMQTQNVGYAQAVRSLSKERGIAGFWFVGARARVALLLVTNVFNELFLKPAWDER
jgi:hypothetical protein